jgi:hypothetical protein
MSRRRSGRLGSRMPSRSDVVWDHLHLGLGVERQDHLDEEVALGLCLLSPAGGRDRRLVLDLARLRGQRLDPVAIRVSNVGGVRRPLVSVIGGLTVG